MMTEIGYKITDYLEVKLNDSTWNVGNNPSCHRKTVSIYNYSK